MLDSEQWKIVWQGDFEAERPTPLRYKPIPPIDVPVLFDSHLIAVLPTSRTASPSWYTAGWINQRIASGILTGGSPDADLIQSQKVLLGRIAILNLPKFTSEFSINYLVPKWFVDINLIFWKYASNDY